MGEEKPDEELMGKRKSSPRLSTTSFDADNIRIAVYGGFIHRGMFFCEKDCDCVTIEHTTDLDKGGAEQ